MPVWGREARVTATVLVTCTLVIDADEIVRQPLDNRCRLCSLSGSDILGHQHGLFRLDDHATISLSSTTTTTHSILFVSVRNCGGGRDGDNSNTHPFLAIDTSGICRERKELLTSQANARSEQCIRRGKSGDDGFLLLCRDLGSSHPYPCTTDHRDGQAMS